MTPPFKTAAGEYAYWFGMLYAAYHRLDEMEREEEKRRYKDIQEALTAKKDKKCEGYL